MLILVIKNLRENVLCNRTKQRTEHIFFFICVRCEIFFFLNRQRGSARSLFLYSLKVGKVFSQWVGSIFNRAWRSFRYEKAYGVEKRRSYPSLRKVTKKQQITLNKARLAYLGSREKLKIAEKERILHYTQ